MHFFPHSFRARRERDHAVHFAPQRTLAKMALAGWRFEKSGRFYYVYSPDGEYHGMNADIHNAARYAEAVAEWGLVNDPAADHEKMLQKLWNGAK